MTNMSYLSVFWLNQLPRQVIEKPVESVWPTNVYVLKKLNREQKH